jgi:PAS domain S-box-containing protein
MDATPSITPGDHDPLRTFEELLDKLVLFVTLVGMPAIFLAAMRVRVFGWHTGVVLQMGIGILFLVMLAIRRRFTFRQRSRTFLALLFLYAVAGMVTWGINGQALILFFTCGVMVTLVDGLAAGMAVAGLATLITATAGLSFIHGWLPLDYDPRAYMLSNAGWLTAASTAAIFMTACVWGLGRLKSSWLGIIAMAQAREHKYATILHNAPDIIYQLDRDGRITFINRAATLYGQTAESLTGKPLMTLVHPEDRPAVERRLRERRTGSRRTENLEVRLFPAAPADLAALQDPAQPLFLVSAQGLYQDKQGARVLQGTQGIARDISRYKEVQRALEREKNFSEALINSLPGIFYLFSEEGRLIRWNRNLESVSGYSADELLQSQLLDYFAGADRDLIAQRFEEVLTQGTAQAEAAIITRDKTAIPFLLSGLRLEMDGQRYMIGTGIDITQRKRYENALAASEAKYRLLTETIEDVIWTTDMNLVFTYISPVVEKMLGWTAEALLAQGVEAVFPENSLAQAREAIEREIEAGTIQGDFHRATTIELALIHHDGAPVWVEIRAAFLLDDAGKPAGVLGVARDSTARRRAAAEKEELQRKLEVAHKMEALGLLAGGVAHDLNNVLSGLVSYPSLLLMKIPDDSPLRKNLLKIKTSGEKAAEIVQDMLTLARRGVSVREVLNLNQLIREHLKSAEHLHLRGQHPKVRVATALADDLLPVEGSPIHLRKSLMNLMVNAMEAQPEGGQVHIATANCQIDRPLKGYDQVVRGAYVRLRIADHGTGIAPEDIDRIFEPFYTRKKMGRSGTGLGMAVVWGTVQDHRGYIHVDSRIGEGTIIELYFPAGRGTPAAAAVEPPPATLRAEGQSVLVIDDDREQRELAAEILGKLNYRVALAASGEAALAMLAQEAFDLLLLDMIMPDGMSGLETYAAVRRRYPNQRAVIVSGFAESEQVREAQRLGAGALVRKPYSVTTIGQALKAALAAPPDRSQR